MSAARWSHAVSTDAPHAARPDVLARVWLHDESGPLAPSDAVRAVWGESGSFELWFPSLDSWTLDTVRMILHELSAYVPRDTQTQAGITAAWQKPRGRRPDRPRAPRLNEHVEFWVSSRGWRASVDTSRNEVTTKNQDGMDVWAGLSTGEWTAPMVATLIGLAEKSPFPLAQIERVLPGDPATLHLKYTPRLTQQLGIDAPRAMRQDEAAEFTRSAERVRKYLDDLLNGGVQ